MRTVLALMTAAVALSGCHAVSFASQPFEFRQRERIAPQLFEVDWRVKLVGPQLWEAHPRETAQPAVDPDTGRIIALTRDGYVRSVSPLGQVEWELQTPDPFIAGATVRDGVIYVPGGDGFLYALQARDGSVIWKYDTGEQLATRPVVTETKVYVASQASTVFAVDRSNGKWLWQYRRDLPSGFLIQGASAPAISMGTMFVGFADGYVAALDPETGAAKWEKALSSPGAQFLDVDATPIVDDAGRLIVASYKDGIYALNPENGDVEWTTVTQGVTGTVRRGDVIFTSGENGLGAVLADDGRILWGLPLKDRAAQAPVFVRGLLVTPINDSLLFVDPATGGPRLSWDPGEGVTARPAWADQHLYVLSNTGWLYSLRFTGPRG